MLGLGEGGGGAQTRRYLKEEKNVPWNGGGDGEAKSMQMDVEEECMSAHMGTYVRTCPPLREEKIKLKRKAKEIKCDLTHEQSVISN